MKIPNLWNVDDTFELHQLVIYLFLNNLPAYVGIKSAKMLLYKSPDRRPLWLLVRTSSVLGPKLASRRVEESLLWQMALYIFDKYCLFM